MYGGERFRNTRGLQERWKELMSRTRHKVTQRGYEIRKQQQYEEHHTRIHNTTIIKPQNGRCIEKDKSRGQD